MRAPGDFISLDICDEPVLAIRGHDMRIRAFSNVCRHRAARLVSEAKGNREKLLTCPYHAWSYDFEGHLAGIPGADGFGCLRQSGDIRLKELEVEIFLGFVFARFAPGGESLASLFAAWLPEMAAYRTEEMVPVGPIVTLDVEADWKTLVDNDLEGYHIHPGHPGLLSMVGQAYPLESLPNGLSRVTCRIRPKPAREWTVRNYQSLLAKVPDYDPGVAGVYRVYRAFPNWGLDCFPDQVMTTQFLPIGPGRAILRGSGYALPTDDRLKRTVQKLNWRMQQQVAIEDRVLAESVQRGLRSRFYEGGFLGTQEVALKHFQELVRQRIPAARSSTPVRGSVRTIV